MVVIKFIVDVIVSLTFGRTFTFCGIVMSGIFFLYMCVRTKILTQIEEASESDRILHGWIYIRNETKILYLLIGTHRWHLISAAYAVDMLLLRHPQHQKFLMHPICPMWLQIHRESYLIWGKEKKQQNWLFCLSRVLHMLYMYIFV